MQINLNLDIFEGPLDLLLYLIKKNDLDISKVSISNVTDQYLEYLDSFKEINIDLVSDYLYMAAELAHIKSKTILPNYQDDEEDEEDPANDLVARLKEYERYKMAATELKNRPWLHRDVFIQGTLGDKNESVDEKPKPKVLKDGNYEVDTFELVKAFADLLKNMPREEKDFHVMTEKVSVTERIYEVFDLLKTRESMLFTELFAGQKERIDIVVTFLSLLEMAKLKMVRIYQAHAYEPIRVKRRMEVVDDAAADVGEDKENIESYR
jgi:segregation and condensation protein A